MKILFAIQGTGNGHLSRARDIYPELAKYGTVDVLVSGIQVDVDFPFPVKYRLYGLSFIFGNKGGVDILSTLTKLRLGTLIRDIRRLPVKEYDLVINDFEPVSAWACKFKKVPCISLSHQCAILDPNAPKPKKADKKGVLILERYAPTTDQYGFHFRSYSKKIFTPVIRKEVRDLEPVNNGHYTVYLPAYDDETIIANLSLFKNVTWQVFSKKSHQPYTVDNIQIRPINNTEFIQSMATCEGVLCGAGFEGPAEAMYLGKKLLVMPMDQQYEQQCNAVAIATLGVPVIKRFGRKYNARIKWWLLTPMPQRTMWPYQVPEIIEQLVKEHAPGKVKKMVTV